MSYRFSIDPKNRLIGRWVTSVIDAIQRAYAEEADSRGLTQAEIARVLDIDRSVVNRRLTGETNLTLRSIGELAYALGRTPRFSLVKPVRGYGQNYSVAADGTSSTSSKKDKHLDVDIA